MNNRKYWKYDDSYLDFGFTLINITHQEHPHCVLGVKVLASECMLPSKLKCHFQTDHPNMASKSCDYFTRKLKRNERTKRYII